jgi:hypothetical protein
VFCKILFTKKCTHNTKIELLIDPDEPSGIEENMVAAEEDMYYDNVKSQGVCFSIIFVVVIFLFFSCVNNNIFENNIIQ